MIVLLGFYSIRGSGLGRSLLAKDEGTGVKARHVEDVLEVAREDLLGV